MHMPSDVLPNFIYVLCDIIALAALVAAALLVNKTLLKKPHIPLQTGVVLIALSGLYAMHVGTKPGMTLHWLGVMMTVMMFGPWLAILLLSAVHILFAFGFDVGGREAIGFNISVCVLIPVLVATACHEFSYRKLTKNFVVYILQVGFGDLLCMLSVDVTLTLVLHWYFDYPSFVVWQDFTLLLALMGGMEAVISTWFVALLVSFLPNWLVTFNDEEYLHGK
jgi:uncharacterized membrane protein